MLTMQVETTLFLKHRQPFPKQTTQIVRVRKISVRAAIVADPMVAVLIDNPVIVSGTITHGRIETGKTVTDPRATRVRAAHERAKTQIGKLTLIGLTREPRTQVIQP